MFSGLVAGTGRISELKQEGETIRMGIAPQPADFLNGIKVGDSIAIDGTCLTVECFNDRDFTVTLMPQTFEKTTFKDRQVGDRVNLERSLAVGGRLEGHIVTGHVDEVVSVLARRQNENAIELTLSLPPRLRTQVVAQGSVALNGVSLTVMKTGSDRFSVGLIPHTQTITNLDSLRVGDSVNLETDILGKYVAANLKVGTK
ncbi:riboflavin synthase [Limosilactobacillus sp.]|uniref:riboflavin synthase n=1 Tax=Limosilactobacillus sp. TaxID=2773925 RepID=UPI0025BB3D5A|nr:riboflavin synthase [Limosilactobacillus sp.]MCH3921666.1 riboflavin synthase [Limosilactobacillus sp.]MCH3928437.1 riboflavin synthase [Limosilactobacillus sp.]